MVVISQMTVIVPSLMLLETVMAVPMPKHMILCKQVIVLRALIMLMITHMIMCMAMTVFMLMIMIARKL